MAASRFSENALLLVGGAATLAAYALSGKSLSGLTDVLVGGGHLRSQLQACRGGPSDAVFDEVIREVEALWIGTPNGSDSVDEGAVRDARLAAERFFEIARPERSDVSGCALDPDRLTERIVDAARHVLP